MFPKNLKISRENLDIKQKDLAKLFDLSASTISGWENGIDIIPIKKLIKYANTFNLSLDYIFGITNKNTDYYPIKIDIKIISRNLLYLRKKHKLTQKEIANKMNTSQSAYSNYEKGKILIPTIFLCELINIYNEISIDNLFGRIKK